MGRLLGIWQGHRFSIHLKVTLLSAASIFSKSLISFKIINETFFKKVGNFLHGLIMVPYYPWKMSHQVSLRKSLKPYYFFILKI